MIRSIEQGDEGKEIPREHILQEHIEWLQWLAENQPVIKKKIQEIVPLIESLKPVHSVTAESQRTEIDVQKGLVEILQSLEESGALKLKGDNTKSRIVKIMEDIMSPIW